MRWTSRCQLILMLCILVVCSAPAAFAAEQQCSAPSYCPPLRTTAEIDGFGTQLEAFRPQDIDPARSQLRPAGCTCGYIQYQSNTYDEASYVSCDDAASKIAADANAEATDFCCNAGGRVCYESPVQRSGCVVALSFWTPRYLLSGYIFYKCQLCDPPIC
jgi:hypothetical protein